MIEFFSCDKTKRNNNKISNFLKSAEIIWRDYELFLLV